MLLIRELAEDNIQYLQEEKDGKKHLYIEGPFISVEEPNRNNRIYRKHYMEPVVEGYIKNKIQNGSGWGELGHPQGPKINEERISHRITNLKWDGNHVIGKAIVLPEGPGKIVRAMIESGGKLGVSTRGLGSVKPNDKGLQEVQNDFKLVTVDIVTDPSGAGCWINGIMEGVEWVFDATKGTWMESQVEPLRDTMKKLSAKELEDKYMTLFEYYLTGLSQKTV